jgi:hypothetical protein
MDLAIVALVIALFGITLGIVKAVGRLGSGRSS